MTHKTRPRGLATIRIGRIEHMKNIYTARAGDPHGPVNDGGPTG